MDPPYCVGGKEANNAIYQSYFCRGKRATQFLFPEKKQKNPRARGIPLPPPPLEPRGDCGGQRRGEIR